uniref:Uncharacterized protein n=1 Tax=Noctiluca scintillans TaxID=2966 RepID=A0A7S1A777_NOCSC|mmetsp:Transcript_34499/g.92327  ORF Transcript_34499/g.92327 Transcript_34499/m.92327 type:complete len:100 (+) Transcript_34499:135-434(+)
MRSGWPTAQGTRIYSHILSVTHRQTYAPFDTPNEKHIVQALGLRVVSAEHGEDEGGHGQSCVTDVNALPVHAGDAAHCLPCGEHVRSPRSLLTCRNRTW